MDRIKIVMVGGGSVSWTPNIVRDMLLTPALSNAEIVLLDIDAKAVALTSAFLQKLAGELGVSPRITAATRLDALKGAQYVIITISTGGFDAMGRDLAIPEKFGIYHTVGDTSGPGGWARLIRNFDVFVGLAKAINTYAPGAFVLNYTNPMTTLTDVLARLCKGPVIGLCHGLFENLALIKRLYKLKGEEEIAVKYAGLNHFFWITEARAGTVDVLADCAKRLKKQGFTELLKEAYADQMGFKSKREVATELFHQTGVMPYLGDRHTSEFFPWYITDPKNLAAYKLVRTTIAERKAGKRRGAARLKEMIRGPIPEAYKKRTRETAADIISAHSQGHAFTDVGNVPNIGQIANLPRGLVVETAVRVDRTGVTPIAFGDLPPAVLGFVAPYAHVFPALVDACFRKDKKQALLALRLDPVCSRLNGKQVRQMGEKLLAAHKPFITAF
jgi:alpha-galactosidase